MNKNIPLIVAGCIFGLVAITHLLRVLFHLEIVVSGYIVPMNVSYIGLLITLALSIWMFWASKK